MNYFYYYSLIIFLICIIIFVPMNSLMSIKETLTNKPNIILIGDSMLNNSAYIDVDNNNKEQSIPGLIKESGTVTLYNYAKDGAVIDDCYSQIDHITTATKDTICFISIGGNNIVNEYNKGIVDKQFINTLFQKYSKMALTIKRTFPKISIYLLNIYKPPNPKYSKIYDSIDQWNSLIGEFARKNGFKIIQTNILLTSADDFIYDYEPSKTGGQKITDAILTSPVIN
jgi:hypothetical protein